MGIVTTEQAVKAKARKVAEAIYGNDDECKGAKDHLVKLIEDQFLVEPPGDARGVDEVTHTDSAGHKMPCA